MGRVEPEHILYIMILHDIYHFTLYNFKLFLTIHVYNLEINFSVN